MITLLLELAAGVVAVALGFKYKAGVETRLKTLEAKVIADVKAVEAKLGDELKKL